MHCLIDREELIQRKSNDGHAMKMPSGLINLLGSRSTLLSGRTPPLHCKAILRGNIMQKLVARFNGVSEWRFGV